MNRIKNVFSVQGIGIAVLLALLLAGILSGTASSEQRVEQAVRQNFVAAGLLSNLQLQGEKMRRYEKEMFIYVAVADKRAGYVKEFDEAYTKLLAQSDRMLAPSGKAFSDEERKQIAAWKNAAIFYTGEFTRLARQADGAQAQLSSLSPEQRGTLTVEYNNAIKEGKDRFRELLSGAEKMRVAKEAQSQEIAGELDAIFRNLRLGVLLGGLFVIGCVLLALRRKEKPLQPQFGRAASAPVSALR